MKTKIVFILLVIGILAGVTFAACQPVKEIIVDNRELIKSVFLEVLDEIIDLIEATPSASINKSLLSVSPDYRVITVEIYNDEGKLLKSVSYDLLKRYQRLRE